jgi:hypothetical protein
MSEDEIKKWMNGGMEIGAHTQNHIHLSNCDIEVAKTEIQQSQSLGNSNKFSLSFTRPLRTVVAVLYPALATILTISSL